MQRRSFTEEDRQRFTRLNEGIRRNLRKAQGNAAAIVRLGQRLQGVRKRRLHELDTRLSFPVWMENAHAIGKSQGKKYLAIGEYIPISLVEGRILGVEALYACGPAPESVMRALIGHAEEGARPERLKGARQRANKRLQAGQEEAAVLDLLEAELSGERPKNQKDPVQAMSGSLRQAGLWLTKVEGDGEAPAAALRVLRAQVADLLDRLGQVNEKGETQAAAEGTQAGAAEQEWQEVKTEEAAAQGASQPAAAAPEVAAPEASQPAAAAPEVAAPEASQLAPAQDPACAIFACWLMLRVLLCRPVSPRPAPRPIGLPAGAPLLLLLAAAGRVENVGVLSALAFGSALLTRFNLRVPPDLRAWALPADVARACARARPIETEALALLFRGAPTLACQRYKEALSWLESALGPSHTELSNVLDKLAFCATRAGEWALAIESCERAAALWREEDPLIAQHFDGLVQKVRTLQEEAARSRQVSWTTVTGEQAHPPPDQLWPSASSSSSR